MKQGYLVRVALKKICELKNQKNKRFKGSKIEDHCYGREPDADP